MLSQCPRGELDLVFPTARGDVEQLQNIYDRCWLPLQTKCGLITDAGEHRYGFHKLRHAAASLFIQHWVAPDFPAQTRPTKRARTRIKAHFETGALNRSAILKL
jgi:hypothetical protein